MTGYRRAAAVAAIGAAALLAAFLLRIPLLRAAAGIAGGLAGGYRIGFDDLRASGGRITLVKPAVAFRGDPLFSADSVSLAFRAHPFGVSAIELLRPSLTIVHHADGTYNFVLPPGYSNARRAAALPAIGVVVRDGALGVRDDTRIFQHSRRLALENIQASGALDPARPSLFSFRFGVLETGGLFPVTGRGRLDPKRGYEFTRIRARTLALAPLLDYALNSRVLHIANGVLNDVDLEIYGLRDRAGTMQRHLSGSANLDHFQPYLNSLAKPLRDGRGALRFYDDGIAIPKVDGSISAVPVRIAGAIYHLSQPTVRLGITGRGELRKLIQLSDAANKLPLAGPLEFNLLVEGSAAQPLTLAAFRAPHVNYAGYAVDAAHGLVALRGTETDVLYGALAYHGVQASVRGTIDQGRHKVSDLAGSFSVPANLVPYAQGIVPSMRLTGTAVMKGIDSKLATTAVLGGDTATQRLIATLNIGGDGAGTFGPLALEGPHGSALYLRANLGPGHTSGTAYVWARGFHASAADRGVDGTLDANFAATLANKRYGGSGNLHLSAAHYHGIALGDITAEAAIAPGPSGTLRARYRGSLADLARLANKPVVGSGRVDIPLTAVASGPDNIVVQTAGGRFSGASVGGVALEALSATVRLRKNAVDVYAARARIGGGDLVAQGSFGDGGALDISSDGFDLAKLGGLHLPLQGGRAAAFARISGSWKAPVLDGGVLLAGSRFKGLAVEGSTSLSMRGSAINVSDGLLGAGPAIVRFDGSASGGSYRVNTHVHSADIAILARYVRLPLKYPAGTLNADLIITGAGSNPNVAGTVAIPEGSLNGLRFRDATLALWRTPASLQARNGRMTVGTTALDFNAGLAGGARSFALRAPRLDLADFDDYFDTGDLFGGRGSLTLGVRASGNAVVAAGSALIADARYRRFALGTAHFTAATQGRTIRARGSLGGKAGTVTFSGDFRLAQVAPLRDPLHRTNATVEIAANSVALETWLPAAGIQLPIFGFANARLHAQGSYPALQSTLHADVAGGRYAAIPVRQLSVDIAAAGGRAKISAALLSIPNLTASATGSFGLRSNDRLAVNLHATSPDIGALATTLTGKKSTVGGAADDVLALGGSLRRPTFADALNLTAVTFNGYTLPRASVDAAYDRTTLTLPRIEIDTQRGRLLAAGALPVVERPALGIGPAGRPIAFRVTADHLDLAQFVQLLPENERAGAHAGGDVDGTLGVAGTVAQPALDGTLALSNFTYEGPNRRPALAGGAAQLTFAGSGVRLHDARVGAGAGSIALSGTASVPSLLRPGHDVTFNLAASANRARLDIPGYGSATIDGAASVARATVGSTALLSGDLAFSDARVPLQLLLPSSSAASTKRVLPPLALNVNVNLGSNVRVQNGQVDLGAAGSLLAGGSLAAPTLAGDLQSTGGTISFYRTFSVDQESTLSFDPSDGVIPYVDAYATTSLADPPTDVDLHVTGLATHLSVTLQSDPEYTRDQIVGLLAGLQQFGAVQGIGTISQQNGGASNVAQSVAENELGTVLQQQLLEPLGSELGGALGLQNLALNFGAGTGFDVNVRKVLSKHVDAVFAESFGYPQRESLGLRFAPSDATAAQLTFFSQGGSGAFSNAPTSLISTAPSVTDSEPASGTGGFAFSLQRKFP